MLFRSRVRSFARIALAALLFAQAAIAAAACNLADRSPAMAFESEAAMPCHEAPPQSKNLCLAECLSADQSAGTPHIDVPVWSGTAPLIVASAGYSGRPATMPRRLPPQAAAPPPRILFQSFLI
jgi:hypothetical protein